MNRSEIKVAAVTTEAQRREWDELASRSAAGKLFQCLWWAEPQTQYGVSVDVLGCWEDHRLVGGALFRSIPIPYLGMSWTECLEGPIFADYRKEWADPFVHGVQELARRANSVTVIFRGCPNTDVHGDLARAFERARLRIALAHGNFEPVISLKGRTMQDLRKDFNERTKRAVKKGQTSPIRVAELTSSEDLRLAYEAWTATGKRRGFSPVPPWPAVEPALRYSVDHDLGSVLATFLEDRILGAVYASYIGTTATYIHGGYTDWARPYPATHILHYMHIQRALERGMDAYSFQSLDGKIAPGVLDFKMGFGAVPEERAAKLTWERRPSVFRAIHRLRRDKLGRRVGEWLRYRRAHGHSVECSSNK